MLKFRICDASHFVICSEVKNQDAVFKEVHIKFIIMLARITYTVP